MKSIKTNYICPTSTKGARIKATSGKISITIPYPHDLDIFEAHQSAMIALCKKLNWVDTEWAWGSLDSGYVFCQTKDSFKV